MIDVTERALRAQALYEKHGFPSIGEAVERIEELEAENQRLREAIKEHRLDTGEYAREPDLALYAALEVDDE